MIAVLIIHILTLCRPFYRKCMQRCGRMQMLLTSLKMYEKHVGSYAPFSALFTNNFKWYEPFTRCEKPFPLMTINDT